MNTLRKVVAVIVLNPENKFVILKRSSQKSVHASLWNLPSGGVAENESLEEAAIRETFEETGLKITNPLRGSMTEIKTPKMGLQINYLLAKTDGFSVNINEESTEYRWVTPEESLNFKFAVSKKEVKKILKEFGLL